MTLTAFIINSRSAKAQKKFTKFRQKSGAKGDAFFTESTGHADELTRQAVKQGYKQIVAVGGDGTLHEVVNGIVAEVGEELQNAPQLGLLPAGSANDFARNFTKKEHYRAIPIYIGRIAFADAGARYFANISSIGIGAAVAGNVNNGRSVLGPGFSFFKEAIYALLIYKRPLVNIAIGGQQWKGRLTLAAAANGKCFGNGLCIAPGADVLSPQFSVTIVGEVGVIDFLKNFTNIKQQKKLQHKQVKYFTGEKINLTVLEGTAEIEADGEYVGTGNAEITMLQKPIMFRVY